MGIMDWLKASGGNGEISDAALQDEAAEVAGLDFPAAVAAHQKWKARLQASIDGSSEEKLDPAVVGRDDQCVLGKWLHGEGTEAFGQERVFTDLTSAHAEFHKTAGMVLSAAQDGRKDEATEMLGSRFSQASLKVIGLLANLFVQARG